MQLLALALLLLVNFPTFALLECGLPYQCQVIVDAGSTGSRAFLYRYQVDEENHQFKSLKLESQQSSNKPLATVHEEEMDSYLNELFSDMVNNTNAARLPISVYGTAGMRLLSEVKQKELYALVEQHAHHGGYQLLEARTISGKEEGLFAWLGVNANALLAHQDKSEFFSVMDFGGSSTQVAFLMPANHLLPAQALTHFKLGNNSYSVFTVSFLGLGLNETLHQYMDNKHCFSIGYPLSNGSKGDGNWQECRQSLHYLIESVHQVSKVVEIHRSINEKWVVLGAMPYLINGIEPSLSTPVRLGEFYNGANASFCESSWETIKNRLPGEVNYSFGYCLFSSYFYTLLHDAYHLPNDTKLLTADGNHLGWSAGALLYSEFVTAN